MKKEITLKSKSIFNSIVNILSFVILLISFLIIFFFEWILLKLLPKRIFKKNPKEILEPVYGFLQGILDRHKKDTISRLELIRLSIHNMNAKKTRTLVTIGGMAVSIGAIVFLVSLGYGLQELVISRVASLEEMKQADVSVQPGGLLKIDDKSIAVINDLPFVEEVLPLISVVGRVNYKSSISDVAVYGVTSNYLEKSALKPVKGKIFDSNETSLPIVEEDEVRGVTKTQEDDISYKINPEIWIEVYDGTEENRNIIGYTRRVEGISYGKLIEKDYFQYIEGVFYLWEEEGGTFIEQRSNNTQVQRVGYIRKTSEIQIKDFIPSFTDVLGVTDGLPWIEIEEESDTGHVIKLKKVELPETAKREAIVNRAMIRVLNIDEEDILDEKFEISFVIVGDLFESQIEKIESVPVEYTIVGLIPDDSTPVIYVPFMNLRSLGISNYSQLKVIVEDTNKLQDTRDKIESMGYITRSVVDTVSQINNLFKTLRTVLAIVGMVALAVASLGMFNTLTVSLLERTREIGLMKTMGMKPSEVSELFLTESMIMGFIGGSLGLILGWVFGQILNLLLSSLSLFRGFPKIAITYIPFSLILIILALSLFVGIGTGIFPSKRVKKISALNALRYE